MKKTISMILALVMVLAAVSAMAMPGNISEIQGLPELPELPTMKVKTDGDTTVTMSAPVASMSVLRNWEPTALEFDENNVAVYSTAGQKVSAGYGVWGWSGAGTSEVIDSYKGEYETDEDEESYSYSWREEWNESAGEHISGSYTQTVEESADGKDPNKVKYEWHVSRTVGGSYPMAYAYRGVTLDGVVVMYNTHGRLVMATMEITGQNFLGSDVAPVKSYVTWTFGSTSKGKPITYISNIEEVLDDSTVVSAVFASNGKRIK